MLTAVVLIASQALSSLSEPECIRRAFADYTNNVLRVEQVDASEWDASNPREPVDRLPANLPFRLIAGPCGADRRAAEAAVEAVVTSMPSSARAFLSDCKILAPTVQWLLRRCRPGVTNETDYLRPSSHPPVWRAADFSLGNLAETARLLTSNSVPMITMLSPIYEEYRLDPISRALPLVDYPDPRAEATCETPYGTAIVLRAPENRRKFRFRATSWPASGRKVRFRWIQLTPARGVSVWNVQRQRELSPENGYAEIAFDWTGLRGRLDFAVCASYDGGPYGPPSTISFFAVPNECRRYDRLGRIASISYRRSEQVIPSLFQNKPWTDTYTLDDQGLVFGFLRTRLGATQEENFSSTGEFVYETHPNGRPKVAYKARYFTSPDDPSVLDYEITDEKVVYRPEAVRPRTRGEFPVVRARNRKSGLK